MKKSVLFLKIGRMLIFLVFAILVTGMVNDADNNLDVLPVEGRNELFHSYLIEEMDILMKIRQETIDESLLSLENLKNRQKQLHTNFLAILGDLPEKTPLNPLVADTIIGDGYYIEKLAFESRPNYHVTANFYIPATGAPPYPVILVLCGHSDTGKALELYQDLCILLANNGMAALIVDPVCQGERNQIISPVTGYFMLAGESGTAAHSRVDVGSNLAGTSVIAYELWDNHRAIDYLFTRHDIVDTTRIGCTGSSGGSGQATYLAAYDDRIGVVAVNSFIMKEATLFKTIGPQDGCQNLSNEGLYGIDHAEYITLFAPKPFKILAATQDFFSVTATREVYIEMQNVYEMFNRPDHISYFEWDDTHGYSKPKREEAVRWFKTWFYGDSDSIIEPVQTKLPPEKLYATDTGQVLSAFVNEKSVIDLNVELANNLASDRKTFWNTYSKDSCLRMVKYLTGMDDNYAVPVAESVKTIHREHYIIEKIKITSGKDVSVIGLLFEPKDMEGKKPAVLYVDGRGKATDAADGGIMERLYVDSGKLVLAIDVRGFGETSDNPSKNEDKHGNNEHRNNVISQYIGKTLIGQRIEDIKKAIDILVARGDVDTDNITIVGIGRANTAVLHTAALDDRISETILRKADSSWIDIVASPTALNNMTHIIPFALKYYDLPDLVKAIAPRKVVYSDEPDLPPEIENLEAQTEKAAPVSENSLAFHDNNVRMIRPWVNEFQDTNSYSYHPESYSFKAGIYFYQLRNWDQWVEIKN